MTAGRIEQAITRIEAALVRLETTRPAPAAPAAGILPDDTPSPESSARVLALVDSHEKLREEVADTLRDLDALIAELEE